jgi:exocyst complex component 2
MSNFQCLRSSTVPTLISQFETKFSLPMPEDAKAFRDVLGQMNARVFQAYVRPTTDALRLTITNGIISPSYAPNIQRARPSNAKAYVYDVLLSLVVMHTDVSSTTPSLTNQILSYMLEQISSALLHSFKQRTRYSLSALMQATLDVEFTAQTLNNYTTEKASEIQGQIYLALDERTDNEARVALQQELPEMRSILKRLREGTKGEFASFRRERKRSKEDSGRKESAKA